MWYGNFPLRRKRGRRGPISSPSSHREMKIVTNLFCFASLTYKEKEKGPSREEGRGHASYLQLLRGKGGKKGPLHSCGKKRKGQGSAIRPRNVSLSNSRERGSPVIPERSTRGEGLGVRSTVGGRTSIFLNLSLQEKKERRSVASTSFLLRVWGNNDRG